MEEISEDYARTLCAGAALADSQRRQKLYSINGIVVTKTPLERSAIIFSACVRCWTR